MVSSPLSEGQNVQGYLQTFILHFITQVASFTDKNVADTLSWSYFCTIPIEGLVGRVLFA